MARVVRYKPDNPKSMAPHEDGSLPFGAFVLSDQIRKPCTLAAYEVVAIAKAIMHSSSSTGTDHYADKFSVNKLSAVPVKTRYGLVPRSGAEVANSSDHAAALEFGSGPKSVGLSSGEPRPQGGSNKPQRILGRAASKVGDFHG